MMQQTHLAAWDMMRLRHGITLRLIDQFTDAQLASNPIAGMRTPIELLVHMYHGVEAFPAAARDGKLAGGKESEIAAGIKTKAQLLEYVKKAWAAGDSVARQLTNAQLAQNVSTPWGDTFPGIAIVGFVYDEYLHHRGQLYAFLRTFGVEPVMLWDFDHSAAEFQPGVKA